MKNPEYESETYFLEFLLRAYFNEKFDFPKNVLNLQPISKAVDSLLKYYEYEDSQNETSHLKDIEKLFITKEINGKNCYKYGLSSKTYYRHKFRYLQTFKRFLFIEIGEFHID